MTLPDDATPSPEALSFFSGMKAGGAATMPPIEEENKEQQEEKKEQQEEKKDDLGLDLSRPPAKKQAKATPDESIGVLRKQRDAANDNLKVFKEVFGDNQPQVIKPLFEYVSEIAEGPITESVVVDFISEYKTQKEEIDKLRKQLEEKEKVVAEVDIRYSDEFKNNFDTPYKEAAQSLFLEFANVDGDNVLAPNATKKLNDFLLGKPDATALEVKSQLNSFVKDYREETGGEEPIVPSVTALMGSLRGFRDKAIKLKDAYSNWSETKKTLEIEKTTQSQAQKEAQDKALAKQRKELAAKAYREFDLESISFVDEKDVEVFVREEYQFGEDIRAGKVPPYDEFVQRGVKTRLWDKYSKQLAELIKFKEDYDAGERNGLDGEDRIQKQNREGKIDWLTMKG